MPKYIICIYNNVTNAKYLNCRIRLREGFNFAHSSSGIINMVLEVEMKVHLIYSNFTFLFLNVVFLVLCVMQYVKFKLNDH